MELYERDAYVVLLGVPVRPPAKGLLRAPAKGAMCGRAVHACSLSMRHYGCKSLGRIALFLVSYMTLAPTAQKTKQKTKQKRL